MYDRMASSLVTLHWSNAQENVLLKGDSDLNTLHNIKNVFMLLNDEFRSESGPKILLNQDKKDDFAKRLILLEKELEGVMKRRI